MGTYGVAPVVVADDLREALAKAGIALPVITDLYRQESCEACEQAVWVGPRIALARQLQPGPLICLLCVALASARSGQNWNVRNLGGGHQIEGTPL